MSFGSATSEEVGNFLFVIFSQFDLILNGVEDLEVPLHVFVNIEIACNITAAVAVVWRRPNCHKTLLTEPVLEAVHHKLVSTSNQFKTVYMVKLGSNLATEEPASSAHTWLPSFNVGRVGPHQITEGTIMWRLASSFKKADLVESLNIRGETSMEAKNFTFNDCTEAQVIKDLHAVLPSI